VLQVDVQVDAGTIQSWKILQADDEQQLASSKDAPLGREVKVVVDRNFEFKLPLAWLLAAPLAAATGPKAAPPLVTRLRLRFSMWQNQLPVDALPLEGWIELQLLTEQELAALAY
jgi:hypothetical protein